QGWKEEKKNIPVKFHPWRVNGAGAAAATGVQEKRELGCDRIQCHVLS
ncbi:hypothetical protein A2U01_0101732, partial [Trifolium medium]|nr:hypothetical protein [Trifolium medium]